MAIALEIIIVPVLLLTVIVAALVSSDASLGGIITAFAGLALLYFAFFNLLRTARREEDQDGDDQDSTD
jgi:threonine/homoserine/homoserine lactone efflux protein